MKQYMKHNDNILVIILVIWPTSKKKKIETPNIIGNSCINVINTLIVHRYKNTPYTHTHIYIHNINNINVYNYFSIFYKYNDCTVQKYTLKTFWKKCIT